MPDDFSFQLWNDDLDRIEDIVSDAMERSTLGTSGVSRVINGPIPYAPDGLPLIGPMPGVENGLRPASLLSVLHKRRSGKVLCEWITQGFTEWDMWSCDPRRYTDHTDHEYCVAKGMEVYGNEYAMHFLGMSGQPGEIKNYHQPTTLSFKMGAKWVLTMDGSEPIGLLKGRRHLRTNNKNVEKIWSLGKEN